MSNVIAADSLDLDAIKKIAPGAQSSMPGEIFTESYRRQMLEQKNQIFTPALSNQVNEYLKTPASVWRARIPVRSSFGAECGQHNNQVNRTCPACRKPLKFGKVDEYEGKVTADCCGAVFFEDPAQYPPNAPGKPNKTMKIPHMDGTVVDYPYFEFEDIFSQDQCWSPWTPTDGSKKHEIFLAGGYIRGTRLKKIIQEVIPDLGWAYFYTGNEQYSELLASIFDRLADLYPGWPLWIPYGNHHNFALNRAGNGLLTREEFEGAVRPMKWGTQFWNTWERSLGFGHEKMAATMPQDGMKQVILLTRAYAAIRNSNGAKKWSVEKYGQSEKLDQHVMRDLFGEMVKLYKSYQPWMGNYTYGSYLDGAIFLSLLTQDRYFFDVANELMERVLYDETYSDHTSTEGSCSYWGMISHIPRLFRLREQISDPQVKQTHPRLLYLGDGTNLEKQLASWRWIIPSFGDTWNSLYPTGLQRGTKPPSEFLSRHFPDYGVSMLRWGQAEGRRQEVCMIYQRCAGHTHSDALGLEVFVDGLPIVWDVGYGACTADTDLNRQPEMKEIVHADWPRPIFDTSRFYEHLNGDMFYLWFTDWNNRTAAHCTVMVDESEPIVAWRAQATSIPITIMPLSSTNRNLEVLDVEMRGAFQGKPQVSEYRRTLLTVPTPNGGGYLVDIFRVTGGKMHEFFYHAISEKCDSNLPQGTVAPGTLAHYRDFTRAQPERMKELDNPQLAQTLDWSKGYRYISDLKRIDPEPQAWRLAWEYDPLLYAPRTEKARDTIKDLFEAQKPVTLSIHGIRQSGSEKKSLIWRARGVLTGSLFEIMAGGTTIRQSTVGFVGGLDMLILERQGTADLKSIFAHLLEGRRANLPAEVLEVSNVNLDKKTEGAVALQVKLAGGYSDYIICLPVAGEIEGKDLKFTGRYGFVRTDANNKVIAASMVRGSKLQFKRNKLQAESEYICTAVKFEGDLTGDRSRPAIIVKTEKRLPEGAALSGNPVNVISSDGWTDIYRIESVASLGKGEWRIALKDHPTFVIDYLTVGKADEKDPKVFYAQECDLSKAILGATYGHNISLISLKTGKAYKVNLDTANGQYSKITLLEDKISFQESGLSNGEKAILIRRQAGDNVVIPLTARMDIQAGKSFWDFICK